MLERLGNALKDSIKKIASAIFVNDKLIEDLVRDIQRALLQADVNVKLVFELSNKIKERALKERGKLGDKENIIRIVYEELVGFFGKERYGILIKKKKPFKIMMIGLFGSGKTTTISKIAHYYSKRGYKIAMLGLDVHRPAAPLQLKQLAEKIKVSCFIDEKEKNPLKIYKKFEKEYSKFDILIIDTAGRDALSKDLIKEIKDVNKVVESDENLLVISADIGQTAMEQARVFHESCGITGVIVTKLDGTARGGGALSACAATKAPIKFIGVGEKTEDIEEFNPEGFVGRLLGMGDIESLLEKAREVIKEEKAEELGERFLSGKFNLVDLYEQLKAMKSMGPLSKIMEMIPGMSGFKIPKEMINVQEEKLGVWKHVMDSCTKEELENPENIDRKRCERIAKGAGVNVSEVKELIKQFKQSKKMMSMIKGGSPEKLMKRFGKMKFGM